MGPTNVALVKLFQADQALREAQERLDAATKSVRIQERKTKDLEQKLAAAVLHARELQAKTNNFDLDLKSRDAHIERLRTQQQTAKNNKEYQAFLIEINTQKVDKAKVEETTMVTMGELETAQKESAELATALESNRVKSAQMKTEMSETVAKLQAEIDELQPPREAAAKALPPKARGVFDRLAEHHDGEAMSAIFKPDRRKEEYACRSCMMDLVTDVYNKLHTRDELIFCPSCRRVLYIPDDLPPEMAVNKRKATAAVVATDEAESDAPKVAKPAKSAPRAKGSLGTLLAAAQGESVKNAVDAKADPAEFNVIIDGKLAGIYKGKTQENLERIIRYRLEEANLVHQIGVEPLPASTPAASEPAVSPEAALAPAPALPTDQPLPASHDPGMPETAASDVSTPAEPPVVNA